MKKAVAIVLTVLFITVIAVLLSAAGRTRRLDADYDLDFHGTTAICTAVVTGERKDDFIQVTMRLKREDVIWKTWNQEGYFQVALEGTCEDLIKNKVYTLEISAKINGNPQPVLVVSKACSGIVPTQPTIPTTQPTTAPTTVPTTPTTQPTVPPTTQPTVPETNPNLPPVPTDFDTTDGRAFVTRSFPNVELMPNWVPPAECLVDHLYWVVESTKECILICDEPIYSRSYVTTDTHIFFVKESEPTKVYVTAIGDFENHQLLYESTYGEVGYMTVVSRLEGYLQFVAGDKKFVLLDMVTNECTVWMEQYYIEYAYLETIPLQENIELREWIWFSGKLSEGEINGQYFYYWKTGEVKEDEYL